MNRIAITLSIATAFAAGCGVTHLLRPALADLEVLRSGLLALDYLHSSAPLLHT